MLIPHSNTPDSQPIQAGDGAESQHQRMGGWGRKVLYSSERALLTAGLICVLVYVCTRIYATATYQAGLWSFSQLKSGAPTVKSENHRHAVDFTLWGEKRLKAYKHALATRIGTPLAVLSIPRLRLDVPVFEGTDELTLNRGAGRIAGTAQLGEQGNIGIAAHRDGFFRSLKDVRVGDRIELAQLRHKFVYTVDNISVVGPSDLTVLQARPQPSLTLVTCYPFYFIGDAPQRYIVQASLVNSEQDLTETVARNFKTEQGEITVNPRYEFQRALLVLAVGGFGLILNSNVSAQVQTQTFTTPGQPTTEVKVDRGTVVLVDGNDLVVKAEDGHLVHFANLPESARATVDGQELGIHDLKPGMTLERTITTTTTPQMITTVKHVTGTVWSVNPPSSVILTLEDGTNQAFKIPDGQKFNIDGQMTDAWGLRKGMKVSATKVTEVPETVVEQEKAVTGTMPPPDPPADLPILVLVVLPVDAPTPDPVQTAVVATDSLPKTASQLPLVGMLGILALLSGLALRAVRVLG